MERDSNTGLLKMKQTGLIERVVVALGLDDGYAWGKHTPAETLVGICWMSACRPEVQNVRHEMSGPTCRQQVSQHVGDIVPKRVATGADMT